MSSHLPPHITEEDVRAIARVIVPTIAEDSWNAAIDAAISAIDLAEREYENNYQEVPMSPRARVSALKRGAQE
jgi:hypothetical protein